MWLEVWISVIVIVAVTAATLAFKFGVHVALFGL